MMKKIGLTGGIGSGKSTVSGELRKKGYKVIDADLIAREIVLPGSKVLSSLKTVFGEEIIQQDGSLDRKKLAEKAFSDQENKKRLDEIMMGEICQIIQQRLKEAEEAYLVNKEGKALVFVDAPLLFEGGIDRWVDEVWMVFTPEEERVSRVAKRDGIPAAAVLDRIRTQMDEDEKKRKSDIVMDNSGSKEELLRQVREQLEKYD
ncbi:MAG: dephospho-CoA kinase [Anaerovoracaceae bacterium]